MDSLSQIVINKLTISEIWGNKVFDVSIPPSQIQQLKDKITLDNLYRENLINEDLDINLLSIAVKQCTIDSFWPYVQRNSTCPFSPEAFQNAQEAREISQEEYDAALKKALTQFLEDLIHLLNSPGTVYDYDEISIIWSRSYHPNKEEDFWKLLIIDRGDIQHHDANNINYFETLDEMLKKWMNQLIDECSTISKPSVLRNSLLPEYRLALKGMKNGLNADVKDLWDTLKEGRIIIKNNFQLALYSLKKRSILHVMDNYLFIISDDTFDSEYPTNIIESYAKEDGLLILTSFFLSENKWNFYCDEIYQKSN